jgi:hypothetical protein
LARSVFFHDIKDLNYLHQDKNIMKTLLLKATAGLVQHCIRAIAGEVVKYRSLHLINFGGGGQVIALKSATALILDRWQQAKRQPKRDSITNRLCKPLYTTFYI